MNIGNYDNFDPFKGLDGPEPDFIPVDARERRLLSAKDGTLNLGGPAVASFVTSPYELKGRHSVGYVDHSSDKQKQGDR